MFLFLLPLKTKKKQKPGGGKSLMHSVYFCVQMHLLDVSLTWLLSAAIFSNLYDLRTRSSSSKCL